jgi:hypothetical protein
VAPSAEATPPGSPQCNATGGNSIIKSGGYFIHTFTSSGTFTPKQAMNVEYLVVGGGGGGGGAGQNTAGGGGGAGEMITGSGAVVANTGYTITIGGGGAGGASSSTRGTAGTATSIGAPASITAAGGGGGGAGVTNGAAANVTTGESAGGGGGKSSAPVTGGTATAPGGAGGNGRTSTNRAGGGGGGDTGNGVSVSASGVGGNGGAGTANSISGASLTYAAGGGGGGRSTAGLGVSGVSGNGGLSTANGVAAPANRGGSTNATRTGGAGGSGVVIVRYLTNAGCPTAPQTPTFLNPTFSWTAPATIPSGQTISSYTVVYKRASDTTYGNIYARRTSGTATSLNIVGTSNAACTTNNPTGWACVSVDLQSGTQYQFKVFARTSTNGLSAMSTAVTYTVP